jgi:hypothetical protein
MQVALDPTRGLTEVPYSRLQPMVFSPTVVDTFERIDLQLGLTDPWGREVVLFQLANQPTRQFAVVPKNFYNDAFEYALKHPGPFVNVCGLATSNVELLAILLATALLFPFHNKIVDRIFTLVRSGFQRCTRVGAKPESAPIL